LIGVQDIDVAAPISADIKGIKFDQHNLFKFVKENNL